MRVSLLVMSRAGVFTFPLPDSGGEVTIGRAAECHVRVDDPKVSRLHARLRIGKPCEIVDPGSANGTFIAGRRLEADVPVPLAVGEMVTVGSTVLVLQSVAANEPARVWSHGAFEARVAEERARALAHAHAADGPSAPGYATVRLTLDGGALASPSATTRAQLMNEVARAEALDRAFRDTLSSGDVVASLTPGVYELLLVSRGAADATRDAQKLEAALREAGFAARVETHHHEPGEAAPRPATPARAQAPLPPLGGAAKLGGALDAPMIDRVAASAINVLVLGETGVGKEVMARRLHERSPRADAPMLSINCAALTESLLESELFGYERGAFTGATQSKPGLLESAQGGSVFLDEVGEMPLTLQAKLLRVLEQREVLRVGGLKPRPIDVRFISATNRDLEAEIEAGRFRRDLYFRLNGISLTVPPLRERVHEIEPLARAFVAEACAHSRRADVPDLAAAALALLKRYAWPGNIRELRNVTERAVVLCEGGVIGIEHLPAEKMAPVVELGHEPSGADVEKLAALYGANPEQERARIIEALTACNGNQTRAAARLGISRRTLVTKLGQYDLPRPRKKA